MPGQPRHLGEGIRAALLMGASVVGMVVFHAVRGRVQHGVNHRGVRAGQQRPHAAHPVGLRPAAHLPILNRPLVALLEPGRVRRRHRPLHPPPESRRGVLAGVGQQPRLHCRGPLVIQHAYTVDEGAGAPYIDRPPVQRVEGGPPIGAELVGEHHPGVSLAMRHAQPRGDLHPHRGHRVDPIPETRQPREQRTCHQLRHRPGLLRRHPPRQALPPRHRLHQVILRQPRQINRSQHRGQNHARREARPLRGVGATLAGMRSTVTIGSTFTIGTRVTMLRGSQKLAVGDLVHRRWPHCYPLGQIRRRQKLGWHRHPTGPLPVRHTRLRLEHTFEYRRLHRQFP